MNDRIVFVRGGGDLGSGVALRLWRCGFRVVIAEVEHPVAVRRTVAFSEAVYDGEAQVEEARAVLAGSPSAVRSAWSACRVPVVVDPGLKMFTVLSPYVLVDAILAKRNTGITLHTAPVVVALGPGFHAGVDVHAVIETNRGPDLGRVIWHGHAQPDTGEPGTIARQSSGRVLRSPADGIVKAMCTIGDAVQTGDSIARIGSATIHAPFHGMVRGLVREGLEVHTGMKVGDIDPRIDRTLCSRVSDKALAISGGVLEAILMCSR